MSALQQARAVYGGWLIARGDRVDKIAGARYLAQALIVRPYADRRTAHVLAAVVDGLHALSMYGLAVMDLHRSKTSLTDAAGATVFAVAEAFAAGRGSSRRR